MLLIILGLVGLWLGTRWIINGAIGIAKRFNLSHSFVGLAILAVGTDLPEMFVSINASYLHLMGIESSGIITGNAIGSCLSQITIILGIASLLINFSLSKTELLRDGIALLSSLILLFLFSLDGLINRLEGVAMTAVYISYYILLIKSPINNENTDSHTKKDSVIRLALFLSIGISVLIFSSHLVVENAMELAIQWDVAQSFVGILLIGLGTSLPELAVSVGAAVRKSAGLSVGNIIGSNIFDGLIPIGIGGIISTTNVEADLLKFDLPFLFFCTLLVILFLFTKKGISIREGFILIFLYLLFVFIKIMSI